MQTRELVEQVEIRARADTVWAALADFGNVAAWAPYMKISHLVGEQEHGIGTRRAMQHAWGFRFDEQVTEWREGEGFAFEVHRAPFPMKNVRESWVARHANGITTVISRVRYAMYLGPAGAALDWALVRFIVRREMRTGLQGLKEHIERLDL